jgi:hypothetical protein
MNFIKRGLFALTAAFTALLLMAQTVTTDLGSLVTQQVNQQLVNPAGADLMPLYRGQNGASTWTTVTRFFANATAVTAPVEISGGTVPTGTTGTCNTGVTVAGGATAGTWTSTGICAIASTIILTAMPTVPTGYACFMSDRTTGGVTIEETATSTTSATFIIRALPTGSIATVANDILQYSCKGY